jgi:hypothetical protein
MTPVCFAWDFCKKKSWTRNKKKFGQREKIFSVAKKKKERKKITNSKIAFIDDDGLFSKINSQGSLDIRSEQTERAACSRLRTLFWWILRVLLVWKNQWKKPHVVYSWGFFLEFSFAQFICGFV